MYIHTYIYICTYAYGAWKTVNGSSFDKHVGLLNMYSDAGFTISTALDNSTCLRCKYTWTIFYGYMSNCQRAAVVLPGGPDDVC